MKLALLALFALAFVGTSRAAPQAGGNVFNTLRSLLALAKLAIPNELSKDPGSLTIPENSLENGVINLVALDITGLKSLDYTIVEQLSDDADTINVNLGFKELDIDVQLVVELSGIYDSDSTVDISIDVADIKAQLKLVLPLDESSVDDLYLLITLGDTVVDVKGIGSEELSQEISETVTANLSNIFDEVAEGIAEPVSRIIKFLLNVYILAKPDEQ